MFSGNGLMARALRSSAFVMFGFGAAQFLRLLSNLLLTRFLFPEAFGLMALVTMVEVGLTLFSDLGLGQSISQSKRGDDPAFLDTAYTIQALRGVLLWLFACALAYPMSVFYDAPELALLVPISAFSMVIRGVHPTTIETAYRHLQVGRVTLITLVAQVLSIGAMVLFAWLTRSVYALVIGSIINMAVMNLLARALIEGHRNRFRWERQSVHELVHFGKWIFLSTVFGFFALQGDKMVFGKYFTLHILGVYNIGFFLGSFPTMLGRQVMARVMIPIYRDIGAMGTSQSAHKLRLMRYLISGGLVGLLLALAYAGPLLVTWLYDARYLHAGGMLVLISVAFIPNAIGMTYDRAALAAGDSRGFFVIAAARGVFGMAFLLIGVNLFGIVGAIAGIGVAGLLVHPFLIWLSIKHGVWDPLHDTAFGLAAALLGAGAIWLHLDEIRAMAVAAAAG